MSGIFVLGQVGRQQDRGTWDTLSNVFLTEKLEPVLGNYGYMAGGYDKNHIWRIDFANDTNLCPARSSFELISNGARSVEGLSSKSYGYFSGCNDNPAPDTSRVHRLDYANDTVTAAVRTYLLTSTDTYNTSHNIDYGYFYGGANSSIQRIDFGNDTAIALDRGDLTLARSISMGFGNMAYGYAAGGAPYSSIDRIDFSSDTTNAVAKGNLSTVNYDGGGSSNSAYGYIAGGYGDPAGHISTVDRLDFSSDTTNCVAKGPLSVGKRHIGSTGNSIAGYHGGASPGNSVLERIDYFNDTATAVLKGNISDGTWGCGGTGNRTKGLPELSTNHSEGVPYGYFAGGDEPGVPGQVSKIDRLDYDNDTATCLHKGNMISAVEQCVAWSTLNYFYTTNGTGNKVQRLSYMNDTATASERSSSGISPGQRRFGVQNTNYGYIGGKAAAGTTVERIDFNNDTAGGITKGPLTSGRYAAGGLSNQSYGYICGGTPSKSSIDRIDFSNDTVNAPTIANLPANTNGWSGSSTLAYGYLGGDSSEVYRIDFSTDTTAATPKGPLAGGNGSFAGSTSNDKSYGYWGGGNPGTSKVHRLDFTNDTSTGTEKGPLSAGRRWVWEGASSSKEAVLSGLRSFQYDYTYATPASVSETTLDPGKSQGYLTGGMTWDYSPLNELSISPGYGYFMGGGNPGSISTIDRIDFGNDTADALVKGNLSHISRRIGAFTSLNYGYRCGGYNADTNAAITDIERLDYTNDTGTLGDAGYLTVARHFGAGLSTKDYGYLGGGEDPSSVVTTVDRLDFSTDMTTAVAKGPLTVARKGTGAVMSADYGYWGGGTDPSGVKSTVDRIDFASDTTACVTKGPLTEAKTYVSGTNSADFGYVGGGYQPSSPYPRSTVDKISFTNDTATAVVKGPLTAAKYNGGSTGNQSYGYWGGGATPSLVSTVDRVDYSNDTVAATAKGPLTVAKGEGFAGTSNRALVSQIKLKGLTETLPEIQGPLTSNTTDYGYFGGGGFSSIGSVVDRVDYSNDTATALVRGSLSVVRHQFSATGNESYGYFAGGETPSEVSSVDRFDYSSDSSVMAPKGPLTATWFGTGSAGNSSYGYFAGGDSHPGYRTTVHRIDYSNDLAVALVKGPITSARYHLAATGTPSYGWFGTGGNPSPGPVTTVDRIDYSNDTPTASPRGPLSLARISPGATGNNDFGYWGGGHPGYSTVDRVDYSSDTGTSPTKGPLSVSKGWRAATGNLSHGYWGGGSPGEYSAVDRIQYSSDTATSVVKGPLTLARGALAAASPKANALPQSYTSTVTYSNGTSFGGYLGGGLYRKSNIERMDYSNDGVDPINKANFPRGLQVNNGAVSSLISGYWMGGEAGPSSHQTSTIHRLDYANDTNVMTVGNRIAADDSAGAFGNKNYGYTATGTSMERLDYANDLAGGLERSTGNSSVHERGATAGAGYGYYNNTGSRIVRLDFANDTVAASEKGPLSYAIGQRSTATGNVNYGWYFGSGPTTVNRVDYSNDTATATVRGYLETLNPLSATYASSHGNENYGYVQGYYQPTIQRIDYANDMATAITRGESKAYLGGAMSGGTSCRENSLSLHTIGQTSEQWNTNPIQIIPTFARGYFQGLAPGHPTEAIKRIDYANDTVTAPSRGTLSPGTWNNTATGNENFGYFAQPAATTTRLDYSNDTALTVAKGSFTSGQTGQFGAAATSDYGYWAGGATPSAPSGTTFVSRLDFSDDTTNTVAKGPLTVAKRMVRGVGNQSYGYFAGNYPAGSEIQRLDYSSDTTTCTVRAVLDRREMGATGNADYGYFGGGDPAKSLVERLDYSSDTTALAPKSPLNFSRHNLGAAGNINHGYFVGGEPGPHPYHSVVERIDFANDSATPVVKGSLDAPASYVAACSGGSNALPQVPMTF